MAPTMNTALAPLRDRSAGLPPFTPAAPQAQPLAAQLALAELFPDLQAAADAALADLFPALRRRAGDGAAAMQG